MIPTSFDYVRTDSVDEAIRLLQESNGEGKLIAGGHSLIPLMKFRLTSPTKLIDISPIQQLYGISQEENRLVIGALTTHHQLINDPLIQQHVPVLGQAAALIGDMQVRNRGTIGGNLAHADPGADLPAVVLALDGMLAWQGEDGPELADADGFFLGPFVTALPAAALLTSVSVVIPPAHCKYTYLKYAHPATGYAVVGVCVIAGTNADGMIDYIRVAVNGAGDTAYRAKSVEQALLGTQPTVEQIRQAAALAADEGEISSDLFASEEYRRHLCQIYTERALQAVLI